MRFNQLIALRDKLFNTVTVNVERKNGLQVLQRPLPGRAAKSWYPESPPSLKDLNSALERRNFSLIDRKAAAKWERLCKLRSRGKALPKHERQAEKSSGKR